MVGASRDVPAHEVRELRVGGAWKGIGVDGNGRQFELKGEYLELDPPRILSSTWVASWTGSAKTKVRWELEGLAKNADVVAGSPGERGNS
jgi:uncharacterized protein YndB with AHSA1/START domain